MRWLLLFLTLALRAAELAPLVDESTAMEAAMAQTRAAAFLLDRQAADGSWAGHPGITAACAYALARGPLAGRADVRAAIANATTSITSQTRPNGAIGRHLDNGDNVYATSMCVMALALVAPDQQADVIRRARAWLTASQTVSGFEYRALSTGYADNYPDLSNTQWAMEALHVSAAVSADDPTVRQRFLARTQRLIAACQQPADGGFSYQPVDVRKDAPFRHENLDPHALWGSLTCGGIKSLIYTGVALDDPRALRARAWLGEHYTLTANPGLKDGGLYYYYYMLASTMRLLGADTITDAQGITHNWRRELIGTLLRHQQGHGQWTNTNRLWMEDRPELCTAYAMLAMAFANDSRD